MPPPHTTPPSSFDPPGRGSWTLDTAHFPQPATRFVAELFPDPARHGFEEATARFGVLLDYIEWAFVNGWAFLSPRPIWERLESGDLGSRTAWEELVASSALLRERFRASAAVFEEKRWREDVAAWDERTKPELRRRHMELQAVDPFELGPGPLLSHLDACRENLIAAIYQHHRLNVAPVIPVGDFLVHAVEWTGRAPSELLRLIRGAAPPSLGAAPELARLADALGYDTPAAALLASDLEPDVILSSLSSLPGPTGWAATEYLGLVGQWSAGSGSDVGEPRLIEMPHLLVQAIRAAAERRGAGPAEEEAARLAADVRRSVPLDRRDAFDALLSEARGAHRVRDERAVYCDVWAYGLARRAILAAGQVLADARRLEEPAHLLEAGYAEMRSLLEGSPSPSAAQLGERARYRREASEEDVPATLGPPPREPVPVEWLPPGAARTERAFRTYVRAMSGAAEPRESARPTLVGVPASPGRYEGRARVVRNASDLGRIEQGDVLVAASTSPAFNVVLPLLGAIVTDRGGLLSHAAILAREYGIPAIVATGDATTRIRDGGLVLVDGTAGEATVLEQGGYP